MQQTLRNWLNSRKDYFQGVAIYEQFNPDEKLLAVLNNGPNDFRQKRLVEELLKIYQNLNSKQNEGIQSIPAEVSGMAGKKESSKNAIKVAQNANIVTQNVNKVASDANEVTPSKAKGVTSPVNPELYNACLEEANNEYKKVMNARAVLFKKAAPDGYLDINKPDLIKDRGGLAIEVVQGWQKVSELFDRANYVHQHGRLPSSGADLEDDNEYDLIPDSLVKQRLDNARKAYNKLKNKERTPERVALLQQHEENIKKLKAKWDSLRPQQ